MRFASLPRRGKICLAVGKAHGLLLPGNQKPCKGLIKKYAKQLFKIAKHLFGDFYDYPLNQAKPDTGLRRASVCREEILKQ
jgi:hypothetical protein